MPAATGYLFFRPRRGPPGSRHLEAAATAGRDPSAQQLRDDAPAGRYPRSSIEARLRAPSGSKIEHRRRSGPRRGEAHHRVSKGELVREIGAQPEMVRRLLTAPKGNPTMATVLKVATALGYHLDSCRTGVGEAGAVRGRGATPRASCAATTSASTSSCSATRDRRPTRRRSRPQDGIRQGRAVTPRPVLSPASSSMIGGIRTVASRRWDPPPRTTSSLPPQTSSAISRIRRAILQ